MGQDRILAGPDGFQLRTEVLDVGVDAPLQARPRLLPDQLHELLAREDMSGTADEGGQDLELVAGELERPAEVGDLPLRLVDLEAGVGRGRRKRAPRPAEDRLHPGRELPRAERLRDVVVGADLEADDAVDLTGARREEDDRRGMSLADLLAQVEPGDVGQADIDQDQVEALPRDERQDGQSLRETDGLQTFRLEDILKVVQDRGLVFDDEDLRLHALPPSRAGMDGPAS